MELRQTPANESGQKASFTVTSALVSAVLEWMLMFMIFIDASFSYLVTRFALYCRLQVPCLLCSRLDHVLGSEKADFQWDLFCHKHKLKMSSLVLCQLHNNLVDVHETCESCFFSFATINKSNAETYRLLVGKLGDEPYYCLAQGESSDEHHIGSSDTRKCTCCNGQWISRTGTQTLFRSTLTDSEGIDHDAPPSITPKCNGDEMQGIIERSSPIRQMGNPTTDPLPHVKYTQITVNSDTESEVPFWDTESANALILEMVSSDQDSSDQDSVAKYVPSEPQIIAVADFRASEKLIYPAANVELETRLGHGLEELNWQQADHNKDFSEPLELVSFTEALPSPDANGIHYDESKETNATSTTKLENEVHVECGETTTVRRDSIPRNDIQMDLKSNKTDNSTQIAESLDLGDAYRLALGTKSRQLSGRFLEQQRSMTESRRASEDLKLLLSQISAARGIELSLNDMSPRLSANTEDFKAMDACGAIGKQIMQRRISLERNESNLSLDGSTISEIEGESVVDRLQRQVEHDRKIMGTLYKELEEERNASAIAANQAMAMITRLQEEKAALHMEALQCLRMMEEQAEFDSEALQNANDLLAEKEKQIQDFELELELQRNQLDAGELKTRKLETNCAECNITAVGNSGNDKNDIVGITDGAPEMLDGDINTRRISVGLEDKNQYINIEI